MELAYAVAEEHWGKGITVEASRAALNWVFQELSPERVQARCKIENKPSVRVMEKLGMKFEGTHRSEIFHRKTEKISKGDFFLRFRCFKKAKNF